MWRVVDSIAEGPVTAQAPAPLQRVEVATSVGDALKWWGIGGHGDRRHRLLTVTEFDAPPPDTDEVRATLNLDGEAALVVALRRRSLA